MALTGDITGSVLASMSASGGVNGEIAFDGSGTDNYNELDNKPSINGVVLEGNKTSSDLHIESGGTDNYNDLLNKPQINGTTLTGNVTDTQLQINYNNLINKPTIPDISDLENRMDTVEGDISDINNDINSMSDDIATLQASDLVQNSNISSLTNRVTGAETNITNLTNRVTSAESSISTHSTEISSIEDNISDINSDIDSLDSRVGTTESDISNLEGIVGDGQQTVGTNLTDAVTQLNSIINSFSTWKTWQPQLYDYTTYKRDFSTTTGDYKYLEIGSLVIAYINVNNQDYSGISTMLQVRNLPMETVLTGTCYFAGNATSGADKVIQMVGGTNQLYPRPNITSAYFANPSASGWTSIIIFGAK